MFNGLFEGLAWVLAFFFDLTHSYGLSIILLTITVMAVVTPLMPPAAVTAVQT